MGNKRKEGYLLVDNRASGEGMQELGTYTCNHCHAIIVMNPQRTRERGFCRACDSWICDACVATKHARLTCVTMDQVIDNVLTAAEKQTDAAISPVLLHT